MKNWIYVCIYTHTNIYIYTYTCSVGSNAMLTHYQWINSWMWKMILCIKNTFQSLNIWHEIRAFSLWAAYAEQVLNSLCLEGGSLQSLEEPTTVTLWLCGLEFNLKYILSWAFYFFFISQQMPFWICDTSVADSCIFSAAQILHHI